MSQTISKIRVLTSPFPDTNLDIGSVKVSVNPGNAQKVQSIQYVPVNTVAGATDVQFENTANNLSVLTYDNTLNKFLVQNIPRINGGTF